MAVAFSSCFLVDKIIALIFPRLDATRNHY
jgi:hypothetical protein